MAIIDTAGRLIDDDTIEEICDGCRAPLTDDDYQSAYGGIVCGGCMGRFKRYGEAIQKFPVTALSKSGQLRG